MTNFVIGYVLGMFSATIMVALFFLAESLVNRLSRKHEDAHGALCFYDTYDVCELCGERDNCNCTELEMCECGDFEECPICASPVGIYCLKCSAITCIDCICTDEDDDRNYDDDDGMCDRCGVFIDRCECDYLEPRVLRPPGAVDAWEALAVSAARAAAPFVPAKFPIAPALRQAIDSANLTAERRGLRMYEELLKRFPQGSPDHIYYPRPGAFSRHAWRDLATSWGYKQDEYTVPNPDDIRIASLLKQVEAKVWLGVTGDQIETSYGWRFDDAESKNVEERRNKEDELDQLFKLIHGPCPRCGHKPHGKNYCEPCQINDCFNECSPPKRCAFPPCGKIANAGFDLCGEHYWEAIKIEMAAAKEAKANG